MPLSVKTMYPGFNLISAISTRMSKIPSILRPAKHESQQKIMIRDWQGLPFLGARLPVVSHRHGRLPRPQTSSRRLRGWPAAPRRPARESGPGRYPEDPTAMTNLCDFQEMAILFLPFPSLTTYIANQSPHATSRWFHVYCSYYPRALGCD
jgi:hypothetical protein